MLEKISRCALAVLLAGFVCLCPSNLEAFAAEVPDTDGAQPVAAAEAAEEAEEISESDAPVVEAAVDDAAADTPADAEEGADAESEEATAAADESADQAGVTGAADAADAVEAVEAPTPISDAVVQAGTAAVQSAGDAVAASDDATTFTVASADELADAMTSIRRGSEPEATITIAADFTITAQKYEQAYTVSAGKTVTILGNGHTLTYAAGAAAESALGTTGGVLNLGNNSGDKLTISAGGANAGASLVLVQSGTVNMYDGATITGNAGSLFHGGAVSVTGGTFNMHGGAITDCSSTMGGGVYVKGATMTMDGNATISNCSVSGSTSGGGAGIYLEGQATLTMSGNAAITGCSAPDQFGGGVFVGRGATMTMEGDASITGNSAQRAGGVVNFGGTFTGGNVYNNTATMDGDDFFNHQGTFTLSDIKGKGFTLASNGNAIDGWYYDGYRPADSNAGENRTDTTRWTIGDGAGSDTAYLKKFFPGKTLTVDTALKAANGDASDPVDGDAPTGDEVYAPNTFNVGNTEQFKAAMDTIKATGDGEYVINIVRDFELAGHTRKQDNLKPEPGQTVTIWGNGHTIAYQKNTDTQLALGTAGGTLNLGKADGSDSLTITLHADDTDNPLLFGLAGGTINMHEGVTLSDNVNRTGVAGGAVCLQNATFNMDGGLISNCTSTVVPRGGAVGIQGGTFNMTGGTIEGCHAAPGYGRHGFGGAVMVGDLDYAVGQFNMGGDAVIRDCSAEQGGAVYIWNGAMTMSGNAVIDGNQATDPDGDGGFGGGVYVAENCTFTMDGGSITHNTALYGGGVYSVGTATVTTAHNNTATKAGDDIYNDGTITLASAKDKNWTLESTGKTIDGWYYDGRRATGDTDAAGNAVKDRTRWSLSDAATLADDVDPQPITPDRNKGIGFTTDVNPVTPANSSDAAGDAMPMSVREAVPAVASLMLLDLPDAANEATALASTAATEDDAASDEAAAADAAPATSKYVEEFTGTDAPTNEPMALKAAHDVDEAAIPPTVTVTWEDEDGTVLFQLVKVDKEHVPPADEYEALSGHDDPEKAADADETYEFEGWDREVEPNGDIVYIAEYQGTPKATGPVDPTPTDPTDPTDPVDPNPTPTDPTDPADPTDPTPRANPSTDDPSGNPTTGDATRTSSSTSATHQSSAHKSTPTASIAQTSDDSLPLVIALIAVALASAVGIAVSRRMTRATRQR